MHLVKRYLEIQFRGNEWLLKTTYSFIVLTPSATISFVQGALGAKQRQQQ